MKRAGFARSRSGQPRTGLSLHIGLNQVDTAAYTFKVPDLAGCVNDANDMQDLARGKGFRARQLLNSAATSAAVIDSIHRAAQQLTAGDFFWITYSGHGSQIPDPTEPDLRSETWVLWDRQLIDNELYALWSHFRPGVRLLVISDSCHSGSVTRELAELSTRIADVTAKTQNRAITTSPDAEVPRKLGEGLAFDDARRRATLYRDVSAAARDAPDPTCKVLLISGCQDNQTSSDGRPDPSGHQNGAFTRALRNVWTLSTGYPDLHARILEQMPPTQSPNLYWTTERDPTFEAQRPFTI